MSMTILAADDEPIALDVLCRAIREAVPDCELHGFTDPQKLLESVERGELLPDVAFLDVEMYGISGLGLAKALKGLCGNVNVIFVTGHSQYMAEAFCLRASGYIMKPVTKESVLEELENLRTPIISRSTKRIYAQAFGNFEVFIDGRPLRFKYSYTKEMLAYLIDRRGALCTNGELQSVLWEDDGAKAAYLRKLKADMLHAFEAEGCTELFVIQSGKIGIDPSKISCDYFDWKDGKVNAINAYHGEYMTQYSWAEVTHGAIEASLRDAYLRQIT